MKYFLDEDNTPVKWMGQPLGEDGIKYPLNIDKLWSTEDREGVGLFDADPAEGDIPAGKQIETESVEYNANTGRPQLVRTYADVDMTKRRSKMKCSRLQAKAILHVYDILDRLEYIVENSDFVTKLAWKEASEFRRDSPLIIALTSAVKWPDGSDITEEDMDDLFISAANLEVA